MKYTIENANKKDIEIITSIKLLTMIDDVMDKKLSPEERTKIKDTVRKEIKEDYSNYKVIYVDKKKAGAFATVPYKKGIMIDELFLFAEYRNHKIGTGIINSIRELYDHTYIWLYQENEDLMNVEYIIINILNKK